MRTHSVGMIRGSSRLSNLLPTEGSRIRIVYDLLYERRGRPLTRSEWEDLNEICTTDPANRDKRPLNHVVTELKNYWGCDVRGRCLVGEWFGRVYLDYTLPAERDARGEQVARVEREAAALEARAERRRAA